MNNSTKHEITEALIKAFSEVGQHESRDDEFKKIFEEKFNSSYERQWEVCGDGIKISHINNHITLMRVCFDCYLNANTSIQAEVLSRIENLTSATRTHIPSGWVLEYGITPPTTEIQTECELNWLVRGIIRRRTPLPSPDHSE